MKPLQPGPAADSHAVVFGATACSFFGQAACSVLQILDSCTTQTSATSLDRMIRVVSWPLNDSLVYTFVINRLVEGKVLQQTRMWPKAELRFKSGEKIHNSKISSLPGMCGKVNYFGSDLNHIGTGLNCIVLDGFRIELCQIWTEVNRIFSGLNQCCIESFWIGSDLCHNELNLNWIVSDQV